jgi:signal peptidase I
VVRRFAERSVLLILAGLAVRTWCVEGLLVPYRVVSGSMAPTLLGPHFDLVCPDCGHRLACDSSRPPASRRAVCPNCGCRMHWPEPDAALAGDRLLVDKWTFGLRSPQRWEVVAIREPDHAAEVAIKRVVGLPGESVQFRDGDLYVDGRIQRKPLAQQRAMAVLVYDASHPPRPSRGLPPRWSGVGPASRWTESDGRFHHPADSPAGSIDWLRYRHWRRLPGGGDNGETQPAPITNECDYNAALERSQAAVRPARDLLLSFRLARTSGEGRLLVAMGDGRKEFRVEIDPSRASYTVLESEHPLRGANGSPLPQAIAGRQIEVWLADARLVLLIEGRPVFVWCYEPAKVAGTLRVPSAASSASGGEYTECASSASGGRHTACACYITGEERSPRADGTLPAIGVSGLGVEISDVRLYRDIDYFCPTRANAWWGCDKPVKLGKDDYFVVGDNSEVSIDSRCWTEGAGVATSLLVGKPLMVHFPSRGIMIGRRHFQVPDLARIRYIR